MSDVCGYNELLFTCPPFFLLIQLALRMLDLHTNQFFSGNRLIKYKNGLINMSTGSNF